MHRRARQHDAEQEEHDDRTDVHEHLHPHDELLAEQDELRRAAGEHHDEIERGVHDVLRPHDAERAQHHRRRNDPKGDVLRYHGPTPKPHAAVSEAQRSELAGAAIPFRAGIPARGEHDPEATRSPAKPVTSCL